MVNEDLAVMYRKEGYETGFKDGLKFACKALVRECNSLKDSYLELDELFKKKLKDIPRRKELL